MKILIPTIFALLVTLQTGVSRADTSEDPRSVAWRMYWSMTTDQFDEKFKSFDAEGYRLDDMEVTGTDSGVRMAGIWVKKDSRASAVYWLMSPEDFKAKNADYTARGYRLIDLEVTPAGDSVKFSAIWLQNTGGPAWRAVWQYSLEDFKAKVTSLNQEGFRPHSVEIAVVNGERKYAALFVKDGRAWGMSLEESFDRFSLRLDDAKSRGLRMIDIESSADGNMQLYTTLWTTADNRSWDAMGGLTYDELGSNFTQFKSSNRPVGFAFYPNGSEWNYAVIWRGN